MRQRLRTADGNLLALLFITALANVPFLSPNLVFTHDTLNNFIFFQFAYSELFLHSSLPRWIPLMGYGIPFDFNLMSSLLPSDYVLMAGGWLFGIRDVLLLSKLSMVLSQCFFILGLYLLGRRVFTLMMSVWMVCLGALFTNAWLANCLLTFTVFYLLPLVLYFLLLFLQSEKPVYLWLAALVEIASLPGTLGYIAPIHLFIIVAFLVPFFCHEPGKIALFWRRSTWLHPLFFVFSFFLLIVGLIIFGMDAALLSVFRDQRTGNVALDVFLSEYRQPLAGMLSALVKGNVATGDMTLFIGVLPLATLALALVSRRDAIFLGFLSVAFFLFWLSLGGYFAMAGYHAFPLLKKYHQLSHLFNILKVFLLILGGFGFDQLLHSIRFDPAFGLASSRDAKPQAGWGRWLAVGLAACCLLDLLMNIRNKDLTDTQLRYSDTSFSRLWFATGLVVGRFLIYAALFSAMLIMAGRCSRRAIGLLILAIYMIDVGCFYAFIVAQAPYYSAEPAHGQVFLEHDTLGISQSTLPDNLDVAENLAVYPLDLSARRQFREPLPEHAENVFRLVTSPRGTMTLDFFYSSMYLLMRIDPVMPRCRLDMMMPSVKSMIEARHGRVARVEGNTALAIDLDPRDLAFQRSVGRGVPKIRIVREAVFTENNRKAIDLFRMPHFDPSATLVMAQAPPASWAPVPRPPHADAVEVSFFSANRMVVKVWTAEPGWLFCADAFHPSWQANIDAQPADVVRANIGCKAVLLKKGFGDVEFYFDGGGRDWVRAVFVCLVSLGGCVFMGILLGSCLAGSSSSMESLAKAITTPRRVRAWLTWSIIASLICAALAIR